MTLLARTKLRATLKLGSRKFWSETLLTTTAILGVLCVILSVASFGFGVKPLVFRSGSMSPTISTGDLAFARSVSASDLLKGDIVSVRTSKGERVTHRVVSVTDSGDAHKLTLKGDANNAVDSESYSVTSADRVLFSIPKAGYVVNAVSGPAGAFVGGLLVALVLFVAFGPGRSSAPKPSRKGKRRAGTAALALVAGTGLIVGSSVFRAAPTWALWSDPATAVSGELKGHTVVSQALPLCTDVDGILVLGNIARLTWAHVNALYEYRWELRRIDNTVVTSGTLPASAQAQGSTVTLDLGTGLIGVNANYNVVIRARLAASPLWTVSTVTTTPIRRASVLIIGTAMRCNHA